MGSGSSQLTGEQAPDGRGTSVGRNAPRGSSAIRIDAAHVIDVFVYVVVLNLAAEHAPKIITESFTTSLAVALLLKVVLEGVLHAKRWAKDRYAGADTPLARVGGALTLLLVLPGSKLVVLEIVALVFGDAVSLGGFFLVTGLILALLLSRLAVRRLLALDEPAGPIAVPPN